MRAWEGAKGGLQGGVGSLVGVDVVRTGWRELVDVAVQGR